MSTAGWYNESIEPRLQRNASPCGGYEAHNEASEAVLILYYDSWYQLRRVRILYAKLAQNQ